MPHFVVGVMNNTIMSNLLQRLRPLVGFKGWDFCVLWKLSEDQRFIQWMDCCCSGTDITQNGGYEDHLFSVVSAVLPCRDTLFQHPRTRSCDLLSKMSSSVSLDSGIYAETLMSNQPSWLNFSNSTFSSNNLDSQETVGTRVLMPIPGGLVELLVSKQVLEDQHVLDFITDQYNISIEQDHLGTTFGNNINTVTHDEIQSKGVLLDEQLDTNDHNFHSSNNTPMNFLQQCTHNLGNRMKNISYNVNSFEDTSPHEPFLSNKQMDRLFDNCSADNGFDQSMEEMQSNMMMSETRGTNHIQYTDQSLEPDMDQEEAGNKDKDSSIMNDEGEQNTDINSDCSDHDPLDADDDGKYRRRNRKGQAKNLEAERKRRKKLNDRLYELRALVPNISKLDRASILGDAIEYVMELQNQVKKLQDELYNDHEHEEDRHVHEGAANKNCGITTFQHNSLQSEIDHSQNGFDLKNEHHDHKAPNGFHLGSSVDGSVSKHSPDSEVIHDQKSQQMEPQVEVAQIDGNQFFVKVFCEHKPGGFVRLMEALSSLSLVVTNANVTSFRCLVSNVFIIEKKDNEVVEADEVRDSLLEHTRNPLRWRSEEMATAKEVGIGFNGLDNIDDDHHQQDLHTHHFTPFHLQHLPTEA